MASEVHLLDLIALTNNCHRQINGWLVTAHIHTHQLAIGWAAVICNVVTKAIMKEMFTVCFKISVCDVIYPCSGVWGSF